MPGDDISELRFSLPPVEAIAEEQMTGLFLANLHEFIASHEC